ncbi:MAG: MFS transporter [Ignavibacteriales bacterium]|nr:MFS transporter [Ignavibacteriaceae bacterium]NLH61475.1 MFS transporter [Ignavibacteriales bacterium]HOJ17497.1 MFS transporter [Ignavibacteriaceae bacterium]HPO54784.1 MFS transporter [Ignavibacteriaceae bacterium]
MDKNRIPLVIIFSVVFIDLLGFGLLIPILPTFAMDVLHLNESSVGILLAVYSLLQFIFNPILGSASDIFGRKNIIIITLLLNAIGYLLFAFTDSFLLLIISRIICGIGGSSIGVAQAYIADITTPSDRSKGMGLIGVAFGMGFVFGPLIGGFLAEISYSLVGYGSMGFSLVAAIFSLFYLPDSIIRKEKGGKFRLFDTVSLRVVMSTPAIFIVIMLFFMITFSIANIYGTFALLGTYIYKFSHAENGMVFGVLGFVGALVQGGLIGRLSRRYSDLNLIISGAVFMFVGLLLIPYGGNMAGILIITAIFSLGTGILQPVLMALVSKVAPGDKQGSILGLNQSFSAFARMLGPLWGGFSFQYMGYQFPFLTGAIFTLLSILVSVLFLKKHVNFNNN